MKNYILSVFSMFKKNQNVEKTSTIERYTGGIKLVSTDSKEHRTKVIGYTQGKSIYPMSPYIHGAVYEFVKDNFPILNKNIFPNRTKGTIPRLIIDQFSWQGYSGIFSVSIKYKTKFRTETLECGNLFSVSRSKLPNFFQLMYVEMANKSMEGRMKESYKEFENISSGKNKSPFFGSISIDDLSCMFGKYGNGPFVVVYYQDQDHGISFYTIKGEFVCSYNTNYDI